MTLFRPVERVGDVLVVGERHQQRSSRDLLFDAIAEQDEAINAVCVESGPRNGYRADRGGAVGGILEWAESENVPRYYVDEPLQNVVEAFGGKRTAVSFLNEIEETYQVYETGEVCQEDCAAIRDDVRDEFGEQTFEKVFTNREVKMAGRAKWVAQQENGLTVLVVGSSHFFEIVRRLEDGQEIVHVEHERKRTGDRFGANMGPWEQMFAMSWIGIKELYSALSSWFHKRSV